MMPPLPPTSGPKKKLPMPPLPPGATPPPGLPGPDVQNPSGNAAMLSSNAPAPAMPKPGENPQMDALMMDKMKKMIQQRQGM